MFAENIGIRAQEISYTDFTQICHAEYYGNVSFNSNEFIEKVATEDTRTFKNLKHAEVEGIFC